MSIQHDDFTLNLDDLSTEASKLGKYAGNTSLLSTESAGIRGFFTNVIRYVRNFTLKLTGHEVYKSTKVKLPKTVDGKLQPWSEIKDIVIKTTVDLKKTPLEVLNLIKGYLPAFVALEDNLNKLRIAVVSLQDTKKIISPSGLQELMVDPTLVLGAKEITNLTSQVRFARSNIKVSRAMSRSEEAIQIVNVFNEIDATLDGKIIVSDILASMNRLVDLTESVLLKTDSEMISGANVKNLSTSVMELASTVNLLSVVVDTLPELHHLVNELARKVELTTN